jgi:hypothetical protein
MGMGTMKSVANATGYEVRLELVAVGQYRVQTFYPGLSTPDYSSRLITDYSKAIDLFNKKVKKHQNW